MSAAGFTFDGVDPGATAAKLALLNKHVGLVPELRRRAVVAGPMPGVWDYGSELGERRIELELVSGDNVNVGGTDAAVRSIASLFDPTREVGGDRGFKQLIFDTEADRYWLAKLVADPFTDYWPSAGRMQLALRCADPFAYSTTQYVIQGGSATLTGFSAYRQAPDLGLAWNLVENGGPGTANTGLTLHANASNVVDATSPSGRSVLLVATGANQDSTLDVPVAAGKTFSVAAQLRSDGTMTAKVLVRWLDAAGVQIGADATVASSTSAAQTEYTLLAQLAPGNARTARIVLTSAGSGIAFFACLRLREASTIPAWVTATDQQLLTQKGLASYEAGTNVLANGDVETALSGTANGFNETYAAGTAWTPNLPAPAANIVTLVAGTTYVGGHPEWWGDGATGSQFRWEWQTGGTMYRYIKYVDASNWVRLFADGTNFKLQKSIAGSVSDVATAAAALTNNTFYWFTWSQTGTSFTCSVNNDSAGALGSAITTHSAQTISDAAVQTGTMAVGCLAVTLRIGGAFSNVCLVKIAAPPSWTVQVLAGVPAFCVSKATRFSGTYSLSVYNNHAGADGNFLQAGTITSGVSYTLSGRVKTAAVSGTGARLSNDVIGTASNITGTTDWTVNALTATSSGTGSGHRARLISASGTAWFDLLWLAQQAYDTGSADPSAQAYATGARTASSHTEIRPADFDLADLGRTIVVRLDHVYTRGTADRTLWAYYVDASNYLDLRIDTAGNVILRKVRAGVTSTVSDALATAAAAGDSIVVGIRHSAAVGLELQIAKNGGAVATYTTATAEAKRPIAGTATNYLGRGGSAGAELDGTIGIDRLMRPGVTAAQLTTSVQSPYAAQDETYEAVVYRFDGAAVPEDYASGALHVDVGGTYKTPQVIELTAGAGFTGSVVITSATTSEVMTWTGTLGIGDVLKIDGATYRVYLNGVASMSGVQSGSIWPQLLANQRNELAVTGIPASSISQLKTTFRNRWI